MGFANTEPDEAGAFSLSPGSTYGLKAGVTGLISSLKGVKAAGFPSVKGVDVAPEENGFSLPRLGIRESLASVCGSWVSGCGWSCSGGREKTLNGVRAFSASASGLKAEAFLDEHCPGLSSDTTDGDPMGLCEWARSCARTCGLGWGLPWSSVNTSRRVAGGGVCPRPAGVKTLKTASEGVVAKASAGLSELLGLEPKLVPVSFNERAGRRLATAGVLPESESTNGVN